MKSKDLHNWMWGEAISMLEQAERLQRQFFRAATPAQAHAWEPPIDVVDTPEGLCIHVALPGVPASGVIVEIEQDGVVVSALRSFPECTPGAQVRRVEIPYGRFERRIPLPMHALELADRAMKDGVLTLTLRTRAKQERDGRA